MFRVRFLFDGSHRVDFDGDSKVTVQVAQNQLLLEPNDGPNHRVLLHPFPGFHTG